MVKSRAQKVKQLTNAETCTGIDKPYIALTGSERFRLIMAAIAQGDKAEALRLLNTCPTEENGSLDSKFTLRTDANCKLIMKFSANWNKCKYLIFAGQFSKAALEYMISILPDDEDTPLMTFLLLHQSNICLKKGRIKLKTLLTALELFSKEIDMPVEHLLAWQPLIAKEVEERRAELEGTEPDREKVKRLLAEYRGYWAERTGEWIH